MKISVAYIKAPRGFKGELTAIPYKQGTQSLRPGLHVTLQKADNLYQCAIESIKFLNDRVGLKFNGIDDEQSAKNWRGAEVLVEEENLAPLEEGEYYHFQLEGAQIYFDNGAYVGKVMSIESLPLNDILNVATDNGEILIPFVKAIMKSVDINEKKIIIRKIDGLF
jgi:16S rRNA processing protein RimM